MKKDKEREVGTCVCYLPFHKFKICLRIWGSEVTGQVNRINVTSSLINDTAHKFKFVFKLYCLVPPNFFKYHLNNPYIYDSYF